MQKPEYHIFVCNSFRVGGEPQGVCHQKGSQNLLAMLQEEVADRGIDAMVTATSCMNICEKGPVLVIYPGEWWYTEVTEESLEAILDALEEGQPADALLMQ